MKMKFITKVTHEKQVTSLNILPNSGQWGGEKHVGNQNWLESAMEYLLLTTSVL